jgi:hypothetical protein
MARSIYSALRARYQAVPTTASAPLLSYTQLLRRIGQPVGLRRSRVLHIALGEVVRNCRAHRLPALSTLVVRDGGSPRLPESGYFTAAGLAHLDDAGRAVRWAREVRALMRQRHNYPAKI